MSLIEEKITLDYNELRGHYRRFESGEMILMHSEQNNETIVEAKVKLQYDNGDYWGVIEKHYKIGDTVRILDNKYNDVGGVIECFIRVGNVVKVKLVNKNNYNYLIDCLK
jgi:hypothetical protein